MSGKPLRKIWFLSLLTVACGGQSSDSVETRRAELAAPDEAAARRSPESLASARAFGEYGRTRARAANVAERRALGMVKRLGLTPEKATSYQQLERDFRKAKIELLEYTEQHPDPAVMQQFRRMSSQGPIPGELVERARANSHGARLRALLGEDRYARYLEYSSEGRERRRTLAAASEELSSAEE